MELRILNFIFEVYGKQKKIHLCLLDKVVQRDLTINTSLELSIIITSMIWLKIQ